jgi:hypothetical protein
MEIWYSRIDFHLEELSGARDFHPRALPEPDMNLSTHPAPIVQPNGFALSTRFLPSLVDLQTKPDNAVPSVQSHYRTFSPTTDCSAPVPRIGTLALMGSSRLSFSLRIGTTGSHVPHKSLDQIRATFMPDAAQAVNRLPLDLSWSSVSPQF